jgi:hypothetical protein
MQREEAKKLFIHKNINYSDSELFIAENEEIKISLTPQRFRLGAFSFLVVMCLSKKLKFSMIYAFSVKFPVWCEKCILKN